MSECKYFKENCIYDRKKILNCEDCFYQQLQELKQENEELKEEIKDWIEQRKIAHNRYMKYQTKLEKIRKYCNQIIDSDEAWQIERDILQIIESEEKNGK